MMMKAGSNGSAFVISTIQFKKKYTIPLPQSKYQLPVELSSTHNPPVFQTQQPNPTTMTKTFSPKPLLVKDLQILSDLDKNGILLHYTTAQILLKILLYQSKYTFPDRSGAPYLGVLPLPYAQVCPREYAFSKMI